MIEKPQVTATHVARAFIETIDQILDLLDDFDALLYLNMIHIHESFRQWYAKEHNKELDEDVSDPSMDNISFYVGDYSRTLSQIRNQHQPFLFQTLLARSYDAFQVYLGDLVEQIYSTMLLRLVDTDAETQVLMGQVLEERRAKLTAAGRVDELIKELRDNHSLRFLQSPEERKRLRELGEMRNLIIHQGGVVNDRFKQRVPDTKYQLGELIIFTRAGIVEELDFSHYKWLWLIGRLR